MRFLEIIATNAESEYSEMSSRRHSKNRGSAFTSLHFVEHYRYDLEARPIIDNATKWPETQESSQQQETIHLFGEDLPGFKNRGRLQNYQELLDYHLHNKTLFCDEMFPPEKLQSDIVWKRPCEIVLRPEFIVDGATRFDVTQGKLGDCWFLAAVANLTTNRKMFEFVVPKEQSFRSEAYAGIFHFRFWQYGRWIDIVVDDRLPTVNGKLIYLKSADANEFWTPLLEKAYAKLYGSYKNIDGGQINEALEDLCGGLSEFYPADTPHLHNILVTSYERLSFMGCSIMDRKIEDRRPDGLITRHAYSITKVVTLQVDGRDVVLVRIRNPWGACEWNGLWSDRSEVWNLVHPQIRQNLLQQKEDGEFWMSTRDFQGKFTYVDLCHLNASSFSYSNDDSKRWHITCFEGSWVPNVTAGGGFFYKETFANNPQYFITIKGKEQNKQYAVVVGLMQKHRRLLKVDQLPLEIAVFAIDAPPGQLLTRDFFVSNAPLANPKISGIRQLSSRFFLPPGNYCIIPSTSRPNLHGDYLLRVFAEIDSDLIENDDRIAYTDLRDASVKEAAVSIVNSTSFTRTFKKIAANESEIGCDKVTKVLNKVYRKKSATACFIVKTTKLFSLQTCRNIVALWDKNYSGKLDHEEFWQLMTDVATLQLVFEKFDKNKSGKLDGFELRNLLAESGYRVNNHILKIIMLRYGDKGLMSFENFVISAFKLKSMIDEYHQREAIGTQAIHLSKHEWLQTTLYN